LITVPDVAAATAARSDPGITCWPGLLSEVLVTVIVFADAAAELKINAAAHAVH
jgi:hypothetical protein